MEDLLPWLVIVGLLAVSGFFSASETALFSAANDPNARIGGHARRLLSEPRALLMTILFGNLVVNLFFFALAPGIIERRLDFNPILAGFVALLAILIFGEIGPKTTALRVPVLFSRFAAYPLTALVRVLTPIRRVLNWMLDILSRAVGESDRPDAGITPEVLADVLERSAEDGLLAPGQADLLAEIVELGGLRVREIMTPRVDMLALDTEDDAEERKRTVELALRRRLTWLPVVSGSADEVRGYVALRDVLADPERSLEQVVMPVKFVPEVADVLKLLATMREDRVAEAVVVDEWGGTAGIVTIEDIFEEIVGDLRVEDEAQVNPVVPLGEGRFRVSGGLSIRDWNDRFGMRVVPTEFETVGGFVTALLGRIPRAGDQVQLGGGLTCEVHEVRGRRVEMLNLFLEQDATPAEVENGVPA